ncbi:hypothetical protein WBG78_24930 [Chryseolinea sp. T2]|uniref:hypothetical protein n=1 Tax=Chryseolinea sp. T2 TaxID=3129255 RepID=UPI003077CA0F
MNRDEIRYELKRLLLKYKSIRLIEALMLAMGAGLTIFAFTSLLSRPAPALVAGVAGGIVVIAIRMFQLRIFQIDEHSIIRYINRQLPQLQESGDLLLRSPDDLTTLEQLQQERTAKKFTESVDSISLPHRLMPSLSALAAGLLIAASVTSIVGQTNSRTEKIQQQVNKLPEADQQLPASIKQFELLISPPGYTQLPEQRLKSFSISAPESSIVSWSIGFTSPIKSAGLIFDGKDTLELKTAGETYVSNRKLESTGFYQLMWTTTSGERKHSDYYPIQLKKDAPPTLKIDNLDQFIQLDAAPKLSVDMKASLSDDYGLSNAYIVATVSKGSGEGIKFREERLQFDSPSRIDSKRINATRHIDLIKLGLDPGDELYYYIEAFDNKEPKPNRARTETYFIAVKDTSEMTTSVDPGLGVDLMPEYFRSQRQIIIDTEKLLKEKKQITREKFNAKSNELAHDEKVLRLRYGEFLGEEFETSIGPSAGNEPVSDDDIVKQYGHQHDTDEEHAARVETPAKQNAAHGHDHGAQEKDEDPSKAYMHAHDSEEEATFFTQGIRAKLKAAVTIMWDAELHLRLYTPEKSLPYQYQALKLLKEISQDSRIYVHRTGFDPPPLKEEKRLTGDLTEAKGSQASTQSVAAEEFPSIRRALVWLESNEALQKLTPLSKDLLLQSGAELSAAAMQQPGRYLDALSLLRAWTDNELSADDRMSAIDTIRAAFNQVLPAKALHPVRGKRSTHRLDEKFLEKYDASPKDPSR